MEEIVKLNKYIEVLQGLIVRDKNPEFQLAAFSSIFNAELAILIFKWEIKHGKRYDRERIGLAAEVLSNCRF